MYHVKHSRLDLYIYSTKWDLTTDIPTGKERSKAAKKMTQAQAEKVADILNCIDGGSGWTAYPNK